MPVLDLIPHKLSFLEVRDGYEDCNGDWHEGETAWSGEMPCHAVAAGAANTISFADGKNVSYSYTIGRLDPDCREFKIGERIKLNIEGIIREFSVKGFHRYQLQSKIWV